VEPLDIDAEERRHHQAFITMGGERTGLHDDHGRRRREAPEKNDGRQERVPCWSGMESTKKSALSWAPQQEPSVGDREDEDVDQEQVQREEPDRLLECSGEVSPPEHVELPGQGT